MKFNIGDRVKVIKKNTSNYNVGETLTITKDSRWNVYWFKENNNSGRTTLGLHKTEIEFADINWRYLL